MRETIQALRTENQTIRAVLAEVDEAINRVILAHYLTHEKELEKEFLLFQTLRARLLWLFASEEKGLIVRFRQGIRQNEEHTNPLYAVQNEIDTGFLAIRKVTDGYRAPADGCATYDAMTANLEKIEQLYKKRKPIADALYQNIAGGNE